MNQRGQVTSFVILGIVIVVIVGVVVSLRFGLIETGFQRDASRLGISEQFQPARDHYESCVKDIALDGLRIVGSQGGYLDVPRDVLADDISTGFSSSLDLFSNDIVKVPYWYYKTNNNLDTVAVPRLEDIQENVQRYLQENLGTCFSNNTLLGRYTLEGYGSLDPEVEIEEDKVFVMVDTPIDVTLQDITETIPSLQVVLDVPLGKLYTVAVNVFEKEQEESFLEERTIDYMTLYDEIPLTGANLDCNANVWRKDQIIADFKEILKVNLPSLVFSDETVSDKYRVIDLNSRGADVTFNYDSSWPLFLEVNGDESILRSDDIVRKTGVLRFLSSLFCLQNYQFVYDLRYPVLVSLQEDDYTFQFGTQVVLDNNEPKQLTHQPLNFDSGFDVCERRLTSVAVDTLRVTDQNTLVPTEADVTFKCFNQVCELGKSMGLFIGNSPQCTNALINADKEGFYSRGVEVSTVSSLSTSVILEPVYTKNVRITLLQDGNTRDLTNELVTLQFTGRNGHSEILNYPDETTVDLVADTYDVRAYVFTQDEEGFTVGGENVEHCTTVPRSGLLGLFLTKEECYRTEIPEQDVTDILIGGGEFSFTVERQMIANANSLVVYLIVDEAPRTFEAVQNIYDKVSYNHLDVNFKKPEFVA